MTVDYTPVFTSADLPQNQLFDLRVSDLRKELVPSMASSQGRALGEIEHPINMSNAVQMMLAVNIQETCIRTKRDATVGLGFETDEERLNRQRQQELSERSHSLAMEGLKPSVPSKPEQAVKKAADAEKPRSKVEEILDPLCGDDGFQSLLNQVGEDYENCGNGYIEVVRDGDTIVSLWHMPAPLVKTFNEGTKPHFHYVVHDRDGTLHYCRFGDLDDFRARNPDIEQPQVTELIQFKQPTSMCPSYGLPSWLSCTPWLELAQKVMQYDFDYFDNRAVPDLLIMLTGAKVPEADIDNLKEQVKQTVGAGNRFRTIISNLPNPDTKAVVERLNADNREKFSDLWATIQLQVVSTHRVPPLLAGVVLPGKMAATNELPNSLVAFQTLYIAQHQRIFEMRLRLTLAGEDANLGLEADDFTLRKITDFYDMGEVDTMSRMRETATEAFMNGRDLEDGLKD